ncbi:MAG: alpha/beta hydrolase [Actinobacteria bacterium]|nr:alpha/beta hydrolase [Actinomycetota bacterium]
MSARIRKVLARVGIVLLAIVVLLGVLLFTPVLDPDMSAKPAPLSSYAESKAAIDTVLAQERQLPLLDRGGSIADLTGAKTPVALVIFHGYTNTPDGFRLVAKAYQEQGYNVWVPRMPHHGLADKMTDDFSKLTAEELRAYADAAIDIASGLGEKVWVMGLSGGGALATWAAAERSEVARTILISPLLNPGGYPAWEVPPMARALRLSPVDVYNWWAPEKGADNVAGMIYPRYSLKGIAAFLGVRLWLDRKPAGVVKGTVLLIRNAGDASIDANFNEQLVRRITPANQVEIYQIPASAHLGHDYVAPDPEFGTDAQVAEGYQQLSKALGIPMPDPLKTR